MIFRFSAGVAVLALAACGSTVPDSNPNAGGGVGFGSYDSYEAQRAARDAQLETGLSPIAGEEMVIAQDTLNVLAETGTTTVAATQAGGNNASISDEQNFDAVASRESIESDRERLAAQRQTFAMAEPEAVPDRPSGRAAPNIVSYALATNNPVGRPVYDRSSRYKEDRYRRNCAEFASPDQAQAAFLAAGGPERDRRGLDPDGDGFACFWDPTPFRSARGG